MKRPCFIPCNNIIGVKKIIIDFKFYNGSSISQKQKSIKSFHDEILKNQSNFNILEISTKSDIDLGKDLSAFNLKTQTINTKIPFTVETAFQSSKVFEDGGPYIDLLLKSSKEAKKDERLKSSGKLIGFKFFNKEYPIEPKTLFYDWLYVNILVKNENLHKNLLKYNCFTDIEFNPDKSINCQAHSVALFLSMKKNNINFEKIKDINYFKRIIYGDTLFDPVINSV